MARKKVLITVATYPLPSRSYDELVCTAGVLENGDWIRIYPVPLSFLLDLKGSGKVNNVKYTWIELELNRRTEERKISDPKVFRQSIMISEIWKLEND